MHHPGISSFVRVRGRRWLVEDTRDLGEGLASVSLACVDDDAQGETADVVWSAELDASVLEDEGWDEIARTGTDDPATFSAYLKTLRWGTVTAADRDLLQAPFRAGIRLDAYQLLPLRKALRLPRVNLLIADDVGAGKTVEAGLVLREMLLRRRVDYAIVAAPAGMTRQWQDELESKFGLSFTIVDRESLASHRQEHGYAANLWQAGSNFIISHSLLIDETYVADLHETLGTFRAKAMLILDEAHHAAPSSATRYAIDSQFTRAVRRLASKFEHRLFLSATPHNGHSNSFSSLLEILDPQRFTRGVPVRAGDLDPVMVRRLKSDLKHFGETFPERVVEPIRIVGLPEDSPDLVLSHLLGLYGETLRARAATLPPKRAGLARLAFVGLQQRLLSSPAAFAHTLAVHLRGLDRVVPSSDAAAAAFIRGPPEPVHEPDDEQSALRLLQDEDDAAAESAAQVTASISDRTQVEQMLALARRAANDPDARVIRLVDWIRANLAPDGSWNQRRIIIFTQWEATRLWLQRCLMEALDDLAPEGRIMAFTGATPGPQREVLKHRFNADPAQDSLRILLCTEAAREGINLQTRCSDLFHFDLPWNPAALEQRNGRIDRKLQPAPKVYCRYFIYAQRREDIVLEALVRKTELIREQLGSVGQVLASRLSDRLEREGIVDVAGLARQIADESDDPRASLAQAELDDATERRRARQAREIDDLRRVLETSRERVGVDPDELQAVVDVALQRAGAPMQPDPAGAVNGTRLYRIDPLQPALASAGWPEALDTLRGRRRNRSERVREWRAAAPLRALAFKPAITVDGADAEGVLQLHLEHRLVRRLLSRFLSQGFQSGLSRACVVVGSGAQPRVVLLGRLALYGPGAARLHEELIPVTAIWTEAGRGTTPLRPLGRAGENTTLDQLTQSLKDARNPAATVRERVRSWAAKDAGDLEPELRRRAGERQAEVATELAARGRTEAQALRTLLQEQRNRVAKAEATPEDLQLSLFGDKEADQRRRDRVHWRQKLETFDADIAAEPARVEASYAVQAERVEIVGLVYLWPQSN